jgi:hypothetical protein
MQAGTVENPRSRFESGRRWAIAALILQFVPTVPFIVVYYTNGFVLDAPSKWIMSLLMGIPALPAVAHLVRELHYSGRPKTMHFLGLVLWPTRVAVLVRLLRESKPGGRQAGLIDVVLDANARVDERDDAAIDLREYEGRHVESVLLRVASDSSVDEAIRGSCGESLAEIWLRTRSKLPKELSQLSGIGHHEASAWLRQSRPEWFRDG